MSNGLQPRSNRAGLIQTDDEVGVNKPTRHKITPLSQAAAIQVPIIPVDGS